ncbi:MAG: hypothetical protein QOE90_3567 [Thermoplasmata archaeon]|nr:hypothetical protein [Thermoplasmata archaeon]
MRGADGAGGMPEDPVIEEGGASTLSQRDASGEVSEKDLKTGERRRGGQDATPTKGG